jgi:hypothetical protein
METAFKTIDDRMGQTMDAAWKLVLQIAINHVNYGETHPSESGGIGHYGHRYEREIQMVDALDKIFSLVSEGIILLIFYFFSDFILMPICL